MKVLLISLLALTSLVLAATEEEETTKGRLYKLIGGVHSGGNHEHHDHHDHEYHHFHRCDCPPGPPGPPGQAGFPGVPGPPGIPGRDFNRPNINNRISHRDYDDYDYGYSRRYDDYRPPKHYRAERPGRDYDERPPRDYDERPFRDYEDRPPRDYDEKPPRDYDYDRRPIPPPKKDYDRYDVPVKPTPVVHHDDRDIRIPEDAPDSDFEKRLNEGRSFSAKRKLVTLKRNPFVAYV